MNETGIPLCSAPPWRINILLTLTLAFSAATAFAQGRGGNPSQTEFVRSNYTKFEYHVAMRDGVKLFTSVYVPKDTSQQYPIMLIRTPYGVGPYGADTYRGNPRPVGFVRQGRIHFRLSGRARTRAIGWGV